MVKPHMFWSHLSSELIEKHEIVNVQSPEATAILQALERIAWRLVPELNWQETPVKFVVSASASANAQILCFLRPPTIIINKGMLDYVKSEDELAYVVGHELGHKDLREKFNLLVSTKLEEFGADDFAVQRLVAAGYNWKAQREFYQRSAAAMAKGKSDDKGLIDYAVEHLGSHPEAGNRIAAAEFRIAHKTLFEEGDAPEPPLTPLDKNIFSARRLAALLHRDFFDSILPAHYYGWNPEQKLAWLTEVAKTHGTSFSSIKPRQSRFTGLLEKVPLDYRNQNQLDRASDLLELLDTYQNSALFTASYMALLEAFKRPQLALWKFGLMASALKALYTAAPEDLSSCCDAIVSTSQDLKSHFIRKYSHEYYYNRYSTSVGFDVRWPKLSDCRKKTGLYAAARTNPNLAVLLWNVGAGLDPAYLKSMPTEFLRSAIETYEVYIDFANSHKLSVKEADAYKALKKVLQGKVDAELFSRAPKNDPIIRIIALLKSHRLKIFEKKISGYALYKIMKALRRAALEGTGEQKQFVRDQFVASRAHDADTLLGIMVSGRPWLDITHPFIKFIIDNPGQIFPPAERLAALHHWMKHGDLDFEKACVLTGFDWQQAKNFSEALTAWESYSTPLRLPDKNHVAECFEERIVSGLFREFLPREDMDIFSHTYTVFSDVFARPHSGLLEADSTALNKKLWSGKPANFSAYRPRFEALQNYEVAALYHKLQKERHFPNLQFLDDLSLYVSERIAALPSSHDRLREVEDFLFTKKMEDIVRHMPFRDLLVGVWCSTIKDILGMDDATAIYRSRANSHIENIRKNVLERDKHYMLSRLADELLIQPHLCADFVDAVQITSKDFLKTHIVVAGAEAIFEECGTDENLRLAAINFLASKLSPSTIGALSTAIGKKQKLVGDVGKARGIDNARVLEDLKFLLSELHHHFIALSVENRAVVLSMLFEPGEQRLHQSARPANLNLAFAYVVDKLFPETRGLWNSLFRRNSDAFTATSFLKAYIHSCQEQERLPLLAAMLSASLDSQGQSTHVGTRLAKLFSLLGPAYKKLGQAINSHKDVPQPYRDATASMKSRGERGPRWELLERIQKLMPQAWLDKISYYGPVMGSASFNTALEVEFDHDGQTRDGVILVQAPHAWNRAKKGFDVLVATLGSWSHKLVRQHGAVLQDLLQEAKAISKIETDPASAQIQYAHAKQLYSGLHVAVKLPEAALYNLQFEPISQIASFDEIQLVDKAKGLHFDEMPEVTSEDRTAKRAIAKAYLAIEMKNILSGYVFDCDRHCGQMRITRQANNRYFIGLFDFGCMMLEPPSDSARQALSKTVQHIAAKLATSAVLGSAKNSADHVITILEQDIAACTGEPKDYLSRIRKGLLALGDFTQHLDPADVLDVLQTSFSGMEGDLLAGASRYNPIRILFSASQGMFGNNGLSNKDTGLAITQKPVTANPFIERVAKRKTGDSVAPHAEKPRKRKRGQLLLPKSDTSPGLHAS